MNLQVFAHVNTFANSQPNSINDIIIDDKHIAHVYM